MFAAAPGYPASLCTGIEGAMKIDEFPDGSVILMGIRYIGGPDVYTYALLRVGGYWYMTGTGKCPQAAGWSAVERWLSRDGREVMWVDEPTGWARVWTAPTLGETGKELEWSDRQASLRES